MSDVPRLIGLVVIVGVAMAALAILSGDWRRP